MRFSVLILILSVSFVLACKRPREVNWQEFRSPEGRFVAQFPNKPEQMKRNINIPNDVLVSQVFYARDEQNFYYQISYFDYPDSFMKLVTQEPERVFNVTRDEMLNSTKSTIINESTISKDGNPGRELLLKTTGTAGTDERAITRMFLVGNRRYTIVVSSPTEFILSNKNVDRFLNSFELMVNP